MVNWVNLSRFVGSVPPGDGDDRFIQRQPIYPLEDLKVLARQAKVTPVTRNAVIGMAKLGYEREDVANLILSLTEGQHRKAVWCRNSKEPREGTILRQGWIACDVYQFSVREFNEYAYKELSADYYLKCGISIAGTVVMVISVHLDEED